MKDKLQRFINNIGGNFVEISYREAIYQCMDLAYAWIFVLDIPKATIQNQYAYQVWTKPKTITREYFDLLENTPDFIPIAGDLAVYKGGKAGHLGIVANNDNDVNGFNLFEQNLPLKANPRIRRSSYNNILGFLRPKVQALPQPEPIIENDTIIPQIIDSNGNAMEVQAIRGALNDLGRDYKSLESSLEGRVNEAIEKTRAEELKDCDKRIKEAIITAEKNRDEIWRPDLKTAKQELADLKIEYEKLLLRKVKHISPFTLFRLSLKKLFSRIGK